MLNKHKSENKLRPKSIALVKYTSEEHTLNYADPRILEIKNKESTRVLFKMLHIKTDERIAAGHDKCAN